MPARPGPLPAPLDAHPFTVAQAAALGVARSRVRHGSLLAPARGLRVHRPPASLAEHAAALALVLPRPFAFSHASAAQLHGIPVPTSWQIGAPVDVIRPSGLAAVERQGVRGHRGLQRRRVTERRGVPVTSLLDTWCDLGPILGLDELVVAGDHVVNHCRDGTGALADAVAGRRGHRGTRRLAQALALVRSGSGSPMETKARLVFAAAGLPEPALNADIIEAGEWLARGDFVWTSARVVVEYEGDHHRTSRTQWLADIARTQILQDRGWVVLRITALDLAGPARRAAMVDRIRRALGVLASP